MEIGDTAIKNIKNLFGLKKGKIKITPVCSFGMIVILNIEVTVIEIKDYQLKNIFT